MDRNLNYILIYGEVRTVKLNDNLKYIIEKNNLKSLSKIEKISIFNY